MMAVRRGVAIPQLFDVGELIRSVKPWVHERNPFCVRYDSVNGIEKRVRYWEAMKSGKTIVDRWSWSLLGSV